MVFANLKNQHQTSKIRTKLVSLVRIFNVLVLILVVIGAHLYGLRCEASADSRGRRDLDQC